MDLEAFRSRIVAGTQKEASGMFDVGDAIVAAIADGTAAALGGIGAVEREAALTAGRGWRTMHRRRVTCEVFPPDRRNDRLAWETHARIAELSRRRDGGFTQAEAWDWLDVAADGEMTCDQVEAAIMQVEGSAPRGQRVYVMRAAAGIVAAVSATTGAVELVFAGGDVSGLKLGQRVAVTIAYEGELQEAARGE